MNNAERPQILIGNIISFSSLDSDYDAETHDFIELDLLLIIPTAKFGFNILFLSL